MYLQFYFLAELREVVHVYWCIHDYVIVAIYVCMCYVCCVYITRYRRVHKSVATKFYMLPLNIISI